MHTIRSVRCLSEMPKGDACEHTHTDADRDWLDERWKALSVCGIRDHLGDIDTHTHRLKCTYTCRSTITREELCRGKWTLLKCNPHGLINTHIYMHAHRPAEQCLLSHYRRWIDRHIEEGEQGKWCWIGTKNRRETLKGKGGKEGSVKRRGSQVASADDGEQDGWGDHVRLCWELY